MDIKKQALNIIEQHRASLSDLALKIHSNPETGLKEYQAAGWISDYLNGNGFIIEKGIGHLPTAFAATYGGGKPVVALLAEYDALPGLGHACGHHLIGMAATAAAVALQSAVERYGGTVKVIGSPSEEIHSGKELLIREGVFDEVDVAMMIHPGDCNAINIRTLACINLEIEFTGQESHASANPENGINALEAMIIGFNAVNSLRQHIRNSSRIHGIIRDGGSAANIVPAHSSALFMVRAADILYLDVLKTKVINCFKGAAQATGAMLDFRWSDVYCMPMKSNNILANIFKQKLEQLGRKVREDVVDFASTDMGNVSQRVPSIHPVLAITNKNIALHSSAFLNASASPAAVEGMLDGARAMALTVIDILSSPDLLARIRIEHSEIEG